MEPLRGGALASPPPAVKAAFAAYPTPRLPYEWALRFVLDRQEVSLVLSGMGAVEPGMGERGGGLGGAGQYA